MSEEGIFVGFETSLFGIPTKPVIAFRSVNEANKWKYEPRENSYANTRDFIYIPLR